mmetsp:Transcript_15889/g.36511  ORF Transcript_15889/g.36511 Transcript_15889/m.36511 type:complete len:149 (+) Transcript_15889:193-639(+)
MNLEDLMMPVFCLPKFPGVLELGHDHKAALVKWMEGAKAVKQKYLAEVETEIVGVNKEHSTRKESQEAEHARNKKALEAEHAFKMEELERDSATKKKKIEEWYKKKMKNMGQRSFVGSDEADGKIEDAMVQIENLEVSAGIKRKFVGN